MTKARRQRVASTSGRPQIEARQPGPVDPATAPVSLPLQEASKTENASIPKKPNRRGQKAQPIVKSAPKPCWYLPEDSKVRETAVKIVMMQSVAGMSKEDIGTALGISPNSIAGYLYKAGKNGWLDFDRPKDNLEYTLMHKVIRNLDESLDSTNVLQTGQAERTATALKIAEGALYPKLTAEAPQQASTIVGIKIHMVEGQQAEVRAGTVMGANTYIDGVVEEAE